MSQPKYEVASDRVVGHKRGETITATDLPEGTNIAALVEAGHLKKSQTTKVTKKSGSAK